MLKTAGCFVLVIKWWNKTRNVFMVDRNTCLFSKRLTVEVLRFDLWDVTCVAGNVLRLDVLSRTTEPVLTM